MKVNGDTSRGQKIILLDVTARRRADTGRVTVQMNPAVEISSNSNMGLFRTKASERGNDWALMKESRLRKCIEGEEFAHYR